MEGLAGSATGRITIGDREGDLEDERLRLGDAVLRELPADPVAPSDRRRGIHVRRQTRRREPAVGGVGRSTFAGLAARVRLGRKAVLESGSGSIVVSLEDFLEGVRTRPEAEALARNVRRVSGSVHVDLRRLAGPLARLAEARSLPPAPSKKFSSTSSSSLPPLSITSGRFAASDDAIRVEDAEARTLDAALRVSACGAAGAGERRPSGDGRRRDRCGGGPVGMGAGGAPGGLPAGGADRAPRRPIRSRRRRALTGRRLRRRERARGLTLDICGRGGKTDVRDLRIAEGMRSRP